MTTIQQLKAARALINWTQADLAKAAGLHINAVNNVERGLSTPRLSTLQKMQSALESGGVTFISGRGVELRDHAIETHKVTGHSILQYIVDDIINTLTSPADDFIALIADFSAFATFDSSAISRLADNLEYAPYQTRIITTGTPPTLLPNTQIQTLPQHQMPQLDILVYSGTTIFINWREQEALILKNSDLAFTQKTFLETLWNEN